MGSGLAHELYPPGTSRCCQVRQDGVEMDHQIDKHGNGMISHLDDLSPWSKSNFHQGNATASQ